MDELMKTLNEAYNLLRLIPVSDSAVDTMYFTRLKMQQAYRIAEEMKKAEDEAPEAEKYD